MEQLFEIICFLGLVIVLLAMFKKNETLEKILITAALVSVYSYKVQQQLRKLHLFILIQQSH